MIRCAILAAAAALGLSAPALAAADKPLVMESAKIKQLPAATTLQLNAPTTGAASINLPHGTAPTSPTDGDCWTTTSALSCRINGSTVSYGSGGGSGTVTTTGSPASGNLAKFSGSTSITSGDLSGDVTTSGTLTTTIGSGTVSLSKMANLSANSIIGNNTGSAATPSALTATQATAMLNVFTSSLKGLAPASGGGSSTFLRADGTWAAPSGSGGAAGYRYMQPTSGFSVADTGAFATLANGFVPLANVSVDQIWANFNNLTIGNVYSMFIATVTSAGVITGTVATAPTRFTTTATSGQTAVFPLSSPVTLTAGQTYIIALVITSGTTTTSCRAFVNSGSGQSAYPELPEDYGTEAVTFGVGTARRFWYTQNSDAPTSGTPFSTASSGVYGLGMRVLN
jgi:hypothetical protein